MKLLLSTSGDETSLSAAKRTAAAQAAATKAMPKTAEAIAKISIKLKALKKKALKAYFARKKADAAKAAKKGKGQPAAKKPAGVSVVAGPVASTSSVVVISPQLESYMLDRQVEMSDSDLMDCCSESAVATKTSAAEKTAKDKTLLKAAKNPKVALRKKQMAAAMRIRENKETRLEIKKLLEMKEKLQDKAWAAYVKKSAAAKKPEADAAKKKVPTSSRAFKKFWGPALEGPNLTNHTNMPDPGSDNDKALLNHIGSTLHGSWQKEFKAANGADAKRIKKTKDADWIKLNGGKDEVDIANTDFKDLPADWKKENHEAAKAAIEAVRTHTAGGQKLYSSNLEKASADVHKKWLERNGSWAPENQKLPFDKLSDEEADKDRQHVAMVVDSLRIVNGKAPVWKNQTAKKG